MVVFEVGKQVAKEGSHDFGSPCHLVEVDHEVHDCDLGKCIESEEVFKRKFKRLLADSCKDGLREQGQLDAELKEADHHNRVLVTNAWH